MKIAIVAPSPVPFTLGGAENLFWGLVNGINQETSHQAELIKLPVKESTFGDLIDSYHLFSTLDLSHFDCVVTTKYPAWMVDHDRHICYLQHRLRGLYDTYPAARLPLTVDSSHPSVHRLLTDMEKSNHDRNLLPEMVERFREISRLPELTGTDTLDFPGPFIRRIVHYLDGTGLCPRYIERYAAISENVAGRADYFPKEAAVSVVRHPSNLTCCDLPPSYDYLFTASRLDGPKRIALLIEAMGHVRSPVKLVIAGTGPEEKRLQKMAAHDDRIRFAGFVNDGELAAHYAHALAVPYFPYDEDYGLITIEAMMHQKPVITTLDAGGPNEFVRDFETGFSVRPDPKAIAEKIDYLFDRKDEAMAMGRRAQKQVQGITWRNVIDTLLNESVPVKAAKGNSQRRKKMTVALTFPVYPPRGGGQSRVYHLYRCLAEFYDITLVCFGHGDQEFLDREIAPGLREIVIPKSEAHLDAEKKIGRALDGLSVGDVTMPELRGLTPRYGEVLAEAAGDADVLVACHPYLVDALREAGTGQLWYEAQDVEWELKKQVLPDTEMGRSLLDTVFNVEKKCCDQADVIMVCSARDGEALQDIFGASPSKVVCVANGVDLSATGQRSPGKCRYLKASMGFKNMNIACFMGSWHPPNLDAVQRIIDFARECPEVMFVVLGSVCNAFSSHTLPGNVKLLGVLDDDEKQLTLYISDLALNPMVYGSGTNLKMLEYFAMGIPVLSTPWGTRGLGLTEDQVYLSDIEDFPDAVKRFFAADAVKRNRLTANARKLVEDRFDWNIIAKQFMSWVEGVIND